MLCANCYWVTQLGWHAYCRKSLWLFTDMDLRQADLTAGEGLVLFVILSLLHSLQQLASKGGVTYTSVHNFKDLM